MSEKENKKDNSKELEEAKRKIEELERKVEDSRPKPTTQDKPLVLTEKAKAMKKALDKQPKETLFIPLDNKEKEGVQTITLNGYPFHIKKGTKVKVPKQVAEVYYDSIASQAQAVEDARERAGKIAGK